MNPTTEDEYTTTLDCIHQVSMDEFCQACQDRSAHVARIEYAQQFGRDYAGIDPNYEQAIADGVVTFR